MFCRKCGRVTEDGKEFCQACRQQDSAMWTAIKKELPKAKERLEKTGEAIMTDSMEELQKAFRKKTKWVTRKAMKKIGLKEKTPLDKAKDFWEKVKK